VSGQLHSPVALPPGKSHRYPFYRRLGEPQSRSGRYGEVKMFTLRVLELPSPLVIQPVASRYTDWAIPAPNFLASVRKRNIPSDRRLSAKLVPTFADSGCRVVSATDPNGRIIGFLGRSRYYFFQVAPQLYSRVWVDHVPDPLLLRKSGSAGNRTRDLWICSLELWPLDHRGGLF
jgi:hypothetical protein